MKGNTRTGKRKKKKFRLNYTRLILTIIIVVVLVVLGLSVKNIVDLKLEQKTLKQESAQLKAEKQKLEEELKSVNDLDYIEEQARTQLNMIKPGEILYITEDQETKDKTNGD